ncbi:MAG: hypothetical protein ACK5XV_07615 [Flavobacteriales bacterium]
MSESFVRNASCLAGACPCAGASDSSRDKKNKCCKSYKHGKRCKKCPGKK